MTEQVPPGLDHGAASRHLRVCPVLRPLLERYGDVFYPPSEGPFHYLAHSIVSQQLSTKVATKIWERFVGLYGGDLPDPDVLAAADLQNLRDVGLSWSKASYLKDLASHFHNGGLQGQSFADLSNEQALDRLLRIKGIGPWSVDMFLMFGLNRPDVLPVGDLGIRKAFQVHFGLDGLPKAPEMEKLSEHWRPWRTVACWYLWRSLDPS